MKRKQTLEPDLAVIPMTEEDKKFFVEYFRKFKQGKKRRKKKHARHKTAA